MPNTIFSATIDPLRTGTQAHSSFVYYPPTGIFGWALGDPGFIDGNFAFEVTSEKGLQAYGRAEALPALKFGIPTGVFLGGDNVLPRKFWYNDKWVKQFTLGAGHVMVPGAYLRGDIMLVYQDADTGNDYMGEFCTQDGVVTPNVWTTGTSYAAGANSYVKNSAGKFYRVLNSPGVASTVEPTHASGTVTTGDTYQWKWLANQPGVFKRFGNLLGAKSTTVNDPITNLFQTWNAAGVTFQGHKTNITDTASAAASVIEEWQVGGTRKVAIGKQGGLGVFGAAPPTAQPTVTGSRGGNAALASLITALAATGIIVDGTSA
jgi:hypothetical protein